MSDLKKASASALNPRFSSKAKQKKTKEPPTQPTTHKKIAGDIKRMQDAVAMLTLAQERIKEALEFFGEVELMGCSTEEMDFILLKEDIQAQINDIKADISLKQAWLKK